MAFAKHSHIGKRILVDLSMKYLDWRLETLDIYQNHREELRNTDT